MAPEISQQILVGILNYLKPETGDFPIAKYDFGLINLSHPPLLFLSLGYLSMVKNVEEVCLGFSRTKREV